MEEQDIAWPQYIMYIFIMIFVFFASTAYSQIEVKQFNAAWNSANDIGWVHDLEDCKTIGYVDVAKNTEAQTKYKIAVVPTIIIFKDGVNEESFKAGLDLECPVDLPELLDTIKEVKEASAF